MSRFAARFAKLKHTRERQRCETRLTSAHLSTRSSIYNPIFVGDESHVIFCPSGAASFLFGLSYAHRLRSLLGSSPWPVTCTPRADGTAY